MFFSGMLVFVKRLSESAYRSKISEVFLLEELERLIYTLVPGTENSSRSARTLSSYLSMQKTLPSDRMIKSSIMREEKKIPSPEWLAESVVSFPLKSSHMASSAVGKPKCS